MDDVEKALSEALNQTGYPFEHYAFETAKRHGWSTRSNRLYIDPEEQKTREMDLLCYRISKGREVSTCTALLISCKARTGKPWALLTREWPDRGTNWYPYPPIGLWTNSNVVKYEVEQPSWPLDYFNLAEASGLEAWAADSPREVFALHEFEAVGGPSSKRTKDKAGEPFRLKPKGDYSLYDGTMSILKALAYELRAVQDRRGGSKDRMVYQFNLIQLLDGDLYEAAFGTGSPQVRRIDRYRYFARTMLDGKDFSARIDFCTRPAFEGLLKELSKVHEFNCTHFNTKAQTFYDTVLTSEGRLNYLAPEFQRRLTIPVMVFGSLKDELGEGWMRLGYKDGNLKVSLSLESEVVDRLIGSGPFMARAARIAKEVYRHDGPVVVEWDDDIPF